MMSLPRQHILNLSTERRYRTDARNDADYEKHQAAIARQRGDLSRAVFLDGEARNAASWQNKRTRLVNKYKRLVDQDNRARAVRGRGK